MTFAWPILYFLNGAVAYTVKALDWKSREQSSILVVPQSKKSLVHLD